MPSIPRRIHGVVARYLFSVGAAASALVLRMLLTPLTGRGAPFVLFFAATLITSLLAGVGPAVLCLAISLPVAVYLFILPEGYAFHEAAFQGALYAVDGLIIVYLTILITRSRDEIARARTRAHETIELAPDAYLLGDLHARISDSNQAASRLFGVERDELIGRTFFDFIPPEDRARLETERRKLLVPGTVSTSEWRVRRQDGSFVPIEMSANILADGRWQAFARDITDRRRVTEQREAALAREQAANAKLRESEERFRLTIDEAPIGMALVALDGQFVRVNRALCEITRYSAEELTRLTFQDITHPQDLDTDLNLARRLAAGEIPRYQLEKRYIRKDGSSIDVMLSASVLRDANGAPRYYIAQVEDISARKRADAALRQSEAKFSGIVSIAADAIISVDEQQRITVFNEGAERIFGYTKSEMIGRPLELLIPERFRRIHAKHFARFAVGPVAARTVADRKDIYGLRKNGQEFPAEASISRVSAGGATYFSVVLRDITRRKQVEEALKRALTGRDEVLGIVAHDLRNPLSAILMSASMLRRRQPEPERRDQTAPRVIERAAKRMNALIQDLLDVAMMESGQFKIEPTDISVAELVREVVEAQEPVARSAGLTLNVDVAADVGHAVGDRNRLTQVFDNLIRNATKFTGPGGRITVSAWAEDDELRFSVADTGIGIAPENLPHVFDRFWQAATRERRLGAGLGLPISRGIVEAHGGRFWVESTLGQGSTFFFAIPRRARSDQQTLNPKNVPARRRLGPREWR